MAKIFNDVVLNITVLILFGVLYPITLLASVKPRVLRNISSMKYYTNYMLKKKNIIIMDLMELPPEYMTLQGEHHKKIFEVIWTMEYHNKEEFMKNLNWHVIDEEKNPKVKLMFDTKDHAIQFKLRSV